MLHDLKLASSKVYPSDPSAYEMLEDCGVGVSLKPLVACCARVVVPAGTAERSWL